MAAFLIASGAELNPSTGMPALHKAVDQSSLPIITLLLEKGANINLITPQSNGTALHHACASSRNPVLPLLLQYHADVNLKDDQNLTPLIYAAINTNAAAISLLLNSGADPLITLPNGEAALHVVSDAGHVPSVKAFIEHASIQQTANFGDSKNETPIVYAAREKHAEVVELLLPFTTAMAGKTVSEVMEEFKAPEPAKETNDKAKGEEEKANTEVELTAEQAVQLHQMKVEGVKRFNASQWSSAKDLFIQALELNPNDVV